MSKAKGIIILAAILLLTPIANGCGKNPPVIAFSSPSFSFAAEESVANPPSQTLNIWNSGEGMLDWSVNSSANWLQLSPSSGTSTGEADSVTLSVDIAGMDAGNYAAVITISASGASNSPQTIPVNLAIAQPSQEPEPSPAAGVIVEDSFVFPSWAAYSEQERQECTELLQAESPWQDQDIPFNKCGLYYNEFFLKQGETVEIIVRSNLPMGPDLVNEQRGIEVFYFSSSQLPHEHEIGYFKQLKRVDGDWEVRENFTSEESGMWSLWIRQATEEEAWCQYAITSKS